MPSPCSVLTHVSTFHPPQNNRETEARRFAPFLRSARQLSSCLPGLLVPCHSCTGTVKTEKDSWDHPRTLTGRRPKPGTNLPVNPWGLGIHLPHCSRVSSGDAGEAEETAQQGSGSAGPRGARERKDEFGSPLPPQCRMRNSLTGASGELLEVQDRKTETGIRTRDTAQNQITQLTLPPQQPPGKESLS